MHRSTMLLGAVIALVSGGLAGYRLYVQPPNSLGSEARFGLTMANYVEAGIASFPEVGDLKFPTSNQIGRFTAGDLGSLRLSNIDTGGTQQFDAKTFADYISFVVAQFLRNTQFEEKFAINATPEEGRVNLYFIKSDPRGLIPDFNRQSCMYVGYYNAIVCRNAYFEAYFKDVDNISRAYDLVVARVDTHERLGQSSATFLESVKVNLKQGILTWILGHELGHSVLHRSLVKRSEQSLHFNFTYNEVERQADDFAAQKLGHDPYLAATGVGFSLGEFIEQEYRKIYRQTHPGAPAGDVETRFFPTVVPIQVPVSPFDFPLILRAITIHQAMLNAGYLEDGTGYYDILSANISTVNDIDPLSASPLLRFAVPGFFAALVLGIFLFVLRLLFRPRRRSN